MKKTKTIEKSPKPSTSTVASDTAAAPALETRSCTIGLDLGDAQHAYCVLDADAKIVARGRVRNDRESLSQLLGKWGGAKVILEAGTHSPWIVRLLEAAGHPVVLANPRKTRSIWQNKQKDDDRDAEQLARLGRADPSLLHPLKHRGEQTQRDLIWLKTRDLLVRQRGDAVRTIRNLLKSLGMKLPSGWSTESFAGKCRRHLAESTELALMEPLLVVIESSNAQIQEIDREITRLIAERYPVAARLQSVRGVGPITALSFVLIVDEPERFRRNRRAVGNYLGLTPKRDQSGEVDKQLRITKEGPSTLRRLLVSCAHYDCKRSEEREVGSEKPEPAAA
jgi:transposase